MSIMGQFSQAIRCTYPKCSCECFSPNKSQVRVCQSCKHGWVVHALDKLMVAHPFSNMASQTETVTATVVFDIASLVLYGCQAIPIRLKIVLDRLFSALQHEEVIQVLHGFGWSYEDYAKGYILQDPNGHVLEKWNIANKEEEYIILQHFLRFAETRTIVQEIILQETKDNQETSQTNQAKSESDIRKFIERNNLALIQSYNLALRRAFENPQSLFSAMGTFPQFNVAAAAAASQFGRIFPPGGSIPNPSLLSQGSPANPVDTKTEPATPSERLSEQVSPNSRVSEPYDLTKRNSESLQRTQSQSSSGMTTPNLSSNVSNSQLERKAEGSTGTGVNLGKTSSPVTSHPSRTTPSPNSSNGKWPFNNPAFGQTFVTASGKKRVLCTACNKTFCDKGALKIHYSAVHLKEMHKCSIPGCNMMFSSRRSRNRHSANPNPKLHTPQARRPRERYESGQGQMMGVMNLPTGSDHKSPLEQPVFIGSDTNLMASLPKDYQGLPDTTPTSENLCCKEEPSSDDISDSGQPAQIQVKMDSPMYRSNKRKRLMPTRVASAADLGLLDDDARSEEGRSFASESHSVDDPNDSADGCFAGFDNFPKSEPEPGEVRNDASMSPIEPGQVLRDHDINQGKSAGYNSDKKQLSPIRSPFTAFLPNDDNQSASFWTKFTNSNNGTDEKCEVTSNNSEESHSSREKSPETNQLQIPVNPDNPRQCTACDKQFQNVFSMKLHYQNVHLKVQHQCTIDGCTASFPSKRSRDRHSMNINLHMKLVEDNPSLIQHFERMSNSVSRLDNDNDRKEGRAKDYECRYCDKRFLSPESLSYHVKTTHQGQETVFPTEQSFPSHMDSLSHKPTILA